MRFFKTRSLAAEYCERERVSVGDQKIKPSRLVKEGDVITISRTGFKQVFEIIQLTDKRLSAKLVLDYYKDITPHEERDKMEMIRSQRNFNRERGTGRPTKRERRDLDDFTEW